MSSVDPEDLSTPARIRNVAVAHFAREGFQRAKVRAIAADAGVSVGLIFHHFGNKDGLRSACDTYVLDVLTRRARASAELSHLNDLLGEYLASPEQYRELVQYMVRAINEDSPASGTFVEAIVAETEAGFVTAAADGTMRPAADVRGLAVLTLQISLAILTMPPPLARALGHDAFGPEVLHRLTVPTLELFTHGLYTDDSLLKAAEQAWDDHRGEADD